MFTKHVSKNLSAYLHGELSPAEARRVSEHLLGCDRCRKEYDEIKFGARLAGQIPMLTAPSEMWSEIEELLNARRSSFAPKPERAGLRLGWSYIAAASAAVIVIAIAVTLFMNRETTAPPTLGGGPGAKLPAWQVKSLAGAIKIGNNTVRGEGSLQLGETLETGSGSRAEISVGQIGHVELEPNSRIRLLEAESTEHRLALDRGTMHARIYAPPRLFFVNTPSAEAIDLGCAYTLDVDDNGRSFLHVTSGEVMLVNGGRESYVPVGAMCETRVGVGPGTPFFDDAPQELREALAKFDFESGGEQSLDVVLRLSRRRDTYTLWHLIQRVGVEQRGKVVDRMIELVGLPKDISREGVIGLDQFMLDYWKDEMRAVWF